MIMECVKEFELPVFNEEGYMSDEEYYSIKKGSLWQFEENDCRNTHPHSVKLLEYGGNRSRWIEITEATLESMFTCYY